MDREIVVTVAGVARHGKYKVREKQQIIGFVFRTCQARDGISEKSLRVLKRIYVPVAIQMSPCKRRSTNSARTLSRKVLGKSLSRGQALS